MACLKPTYPDNTQDIQAGDLLETTHLAGEPRQYIADSIGQYGVWIKGGSGIVGTGWRRVPFNKCALLKKADPDGEPLRPTLFS